jgi:hypothetical protein
LVVFVHWPTVRSVGPRAIVAPVVGVVALHRDPGMIRDDSVDESHF